MAIPTLAVGIVAVLGALWLALGYFTGIDTEPGEPPFVTPTLPVTGHMVGMLRHKVQYYVRLWERTNLPIFGINMLGKRFYVVTTPSLAVAVQKNTASLSFRTYGAALGAKLSGYSAHAQEVMKRGLSNDVSGEGFVNVVHNGMKSHFGLGSSLDELNTKAASQILAVVNSIDAKAGPVDLAKWARHNMVDVGTAAFYGPNHPLTKPGAAQAWINLEDAGFTSLMFTPFPEYLAREAVRDRQIVIDAIQSYIASDVPKREASQYILGRWETFREYDIATSDVGSLDLGLLLALNSNSSSSIFWILWNILSRPELLKILRAEVEAVLKTETKTSPHEYSLNMQDLKEKCPRLNSTALEVLRLYSFGVTTREVLEDTTVDTYRLKKGAVVMSPSQAFHMNPSVYGATAHEFDPERFLPASERKPSYAKTKVPSGGWRAFGGGATLCPGRHFALSEMLGLTALLIMRFDVKPVKGDWEGPEPDLSNILIAVPQPKKGLLVEFVERRPWCEGKWGLAASALTKVYDASLAL